MTSRRTFVAIVSGGLVATPLAAGAQLAGKMYRIGQLSTLPPGSSGVARVWGAFAQGLKELGYVEGENYVIERRWAPEGQPDRLRELAADLVRLKVDVIVAGGSLTPHAAKSVTTTLPVVFANHGDPLGSGLVVSLARPGGNVTGLSSSAPSSSGSNWSCSRRPSPEPSGWPSCGTPPVEPTLAC